MPNFVYVHQVDEEQRPQSENVKLFKPGGLGLFEKGLLEDEAVQDEDTD
jgi:hypothetical protein